MAYGNELTPAVIDAIRGNNGGSGYGLGNGDGILWLLLFIILGGVGGRGYGSGGGYGAGSVGGNELYPWLNNAENINGGFRDQMLATNINGITQAVSSLSTQLCNCCGDMQMAVANGFNGVNVGMLNGFNGAEVAANARQMANMQQAFAAQTATTQGFNGLQAQLADCCCENRLATANQTATILAEHCSDRAALSDGVRDIIASNQAGTQRIIDKLCDQELQAERRENDNLRQQINMMNLAASQAQQTQQLLADNFAQTNALEQYLAPVPRPAYVVQNPNCCQPSYGCGCAA